MCGGSLTNGPNAAVISIRHDTGWSIATTVLIGGRVGSFVTAGSGFHATTAAEGSVDQIFSSMIFMRTQNVRVGKRRKDFGDPIWRLVASLKVRIRSRRIGRLPALIPAERERTYEGSHAWH